jgi:hypothetical protein
MNVLKTIFHKDKVDKSLPSLEEIKAEAHRNLTEGLAQIEAQDWPEWKKEIWRNCIYDQMHANITWQPESNADDET